MDCGDNQPIVGDSFIRVAWGAATDKAKNPAPAHGTPLTSLTTAADCAAWLILNATDRDHPRKPCAGLSEELGYRNGCPRKSGQFLDLSSRVMGCAARVRRAARSLGTTSCADRSRFFVPQSRSPNPRAKGNVDDDRWTRRADLARRPWRGSGPPRWCHASSHAGEQRHTPDQTGHRQPGHRRSDDPHLCHRRPLSSVLADQRSAQLG